MDDERLTSLNLDRAELGERSATATSEVDTRPQADPADHCQVSIRRTVRESLPTLLAHPHDGVRRLKAVRKLKQNASTTTTTTTTDTADAATSQESDQPPQRHAPILAPAPPYATGEERLEHDLEVPTRRFPPAKDFIHRPFAALKVVAKDQGGHDFAANVMKSEVSHGESVKLLQQEEKLLARREVEDEGDGDQEMERFAELKAARQDAFVRWSVDRHIRRVGVLRSVDEVPRWPKSGDGREPWAGYAQQVCVQDLCGPC
jgi:hypothetical protein